MTFCHHLGKARVKKYQNLYTFYVFQKMNLLYYCPNSFYAMVVIGSLSMVGDGGGRGGVRRALAGRWEDVRRALAGGW